MFDVGFWEVAIIALIALLVIGPDRLPKAARTAGLWVGRARRMVAQVKSDIDREVRESELAELREIENITDEIKKTKNAMESAGGDLIKESGVDEIKQTGEELKSAKQKMESLQEEILAPGDEVNMKPSSPIAEPDLSSSKSILKDTKV
ncbi:MAG: twin-arginine translocase subunit TatB [Acidiferrobacteraceae bacterium]|nr:twin-arginine translocase subunit TatB [Acidiferrobacteraceae bacterium]|tara:strand:+ start:64 stop:510 length:447 start_codon:yes stop_codon:yes gene_type:complete